MKKSIIRPALIALGALTLLLFAGCNMVNVQPWERATLSEYTMRTDRDPISVAMDDHVFFSREATGGGRGVGGSGCGCN